MKQAEEHRRWVAAVLEQVKAVDSDPTGGGLQVLFPEPTGGGAPRRLLPDPATSWARRRPALDPPASWERDGGMGLRGAARRGGG